MDTNSLSAIIRMAWEDRTTFDEIKSKTGFSEKDVIKLMRTSLKPAGFRRWRKRVTGRVTKHRRPFNNDRMAQRRSHVYWLTCED